MNKKVLDKNNQVSSERILKKESRLKHPGTPSLKTKSARIERLYIRTYCMTWAREKILGLGSWKYQTKTQKPVFDFKRKKISLFIDLDNVVQLRRGPFAL